MVHSVRPFATPRGRHTTSSNGATAPVPLTVTTMDITVSSVSPVAFTIDHHERGTSSAQDLATLWSLKEGEFVYTVTLASALYPKRS